MEIQECGANVSWNELCNQMPPEYCSFNTKSNKKLTHIEQAFHSHKENSMSETLLYKCFLVRLLTREHTFMNTVSIFVIVLLTIWYQRHWHCWSLSSSLSLSRGSCLHIVNAVPSSCLSNRFAITKSRPNHKAQSAHNLSLLLSLYTFSTTKSFCYGKLTLVIDNKLFFI